MKQLKIKLCLLTLLVVISSACRKKECDDLGDQGSAYVSSIQIDFVDTGGDPLIRQTGGQMTLADVKLFDENLTELSLRSVEKIINGKLGYTIIFSPLDIKQNYPDDKILTRKMYIDLKGSRDVVDCEFELGNLTCGGSKLKYLNVKYNNIEVAKFINNQVAAFNITK